MRWICKVLLELGVFMAMVWTSHTAGKTIDIREIIDSFPSQIFDLTVQYTEPVIREN